ncbi:MAG: restriction endonuclease [Gemmatimonadetes bacterium]|nr:restriction endonuclease [Gemmatimonadota bacterium]MYF74279.1 restriction endonuclease [Gemmatimonadota bacterium]MYK51542.1 restriction endonuclease [Gemmatimonadota bacterium]
MADNFNPDVPTFNDLLNPTLTALHALGGSASIREITNQVIKQMELSSCIAQVPHGRGSQTELEYRLGWARTALKKYGLINNSERGIWSLTAKGSKTQNVDHGEVRKVIQQNQAGKQANTDEGVLPQEIKISAEDFANETATWREDLLDILRNISPDAFERLCQRLLRESGFIEVEVTGKSGDGGIDGHGIIRLAGLISFPVLFQCKRYKESVSASVVRDFRGAMQGRADKGLILTTGSFTRGAQREATRDGAPPIDLIDGELLMEKMKDLKLGVSVKTKRVEVVEVDRSWFDSI